MRGSARKHLTLGLTVIGALLTSAPAAMATPNTWTSAAPIPTARQWAMGASLPGGKVLVTGGEDDNFNILGDTEVYDPSNDTWTTQSRVPPGPAI